MLVPTKAQQSSVDDLRDGLAELRQAQSRLIESSEMDVLRRLLETKAGRDQLEDILRRLKELEEAEQRFLELYRADLGELPPLLATKSAP